MIRIAWLASQIYLVPEYISQEHSHASCMSCNCKVKYQPFVAFLEKHHRGAFLMGKAYNLDVDGTSKKKLSVVQIRTIDSFYSPFLISLKEGRNSNNFPTFCSYFLLQKSGGFFFLSFFLSHFPTHFMDFFPTLFIRPWRFNFLQFEEFNLK